MHSQNAQDGAIFKHEHPTKLYFTLICSAGFMAGLGLAHNSVVVIVASMLVSPLMGSVIFARLHVILVVEPEVTFCFTCNGSVQLCTAVLASVYCEVTNKRTGTACIYRL